MELARTYWFLNNKINQPKIDYYQYSNKTPYERGIEALDYYRYYGGKPLNIEKTYYNRLLMPIFDDLDLFQLSITRILLNIKELQTSFNQDETIKELINLTKTIPILVKEFLKNQKNYLKSIIQELKLTKKGIKTDINSIISSRTILLPFVQFMQHRELKTQDILKNIRLKYKISLNKVRSLRENLLVEENLVEKFEAKKEVEEFNDYLIYFQKNLESKGRIMKIERIKMKINDIQMKLEKEVLKTNEDVKVRRNVVYVGFYRYQDINKSENVNIEINSKKSKISKISKKSKKSKSKSTKTKNTKKNEESEKDNTKKSKKENNNKMSKQSNINDNEK